MSTPTDTYRRELLTALRMRGVHPDRIGEALAEVDSHVAETHEDPADAFGSPRTYAESFPARDAGQPLVVRAGRGIALAAAGAATGLLGVGGVVGLVDGEDRVVGLPPVVLLLIGLLLALAGAIALARRAGVVHDPRTDAEADPDARWLAPTLFAGYVLLLAIVAGITALAG